MLERVFKMNEPTEPFRRKYGQAGPSLSTASPGFHALHPMYHATVSIQAA